MLLQLLLIIGVIICIPAFVVAFVLARHFLHVRRQMLAAKNCVCPCCGYNIGVEGLQEADRRWADHLAILHRKHPQTKFRLIRLFDAICIACGVQLRFRRETGAFGELMREMSLESGDSVSLVGVLWKTPDGCVLRDYIPPADRPEIRGDVLLNMRGLRTYLMFYANIIWLLGGGPTIAARAVGRLAFDRKEGYSLDPVERLVAIPVHGERVVITAGVISAEERRALHEGRDNDARKLSSL